MSPLRRVLEDYLSVRHAMGFKLESTGRLLGQFVTYLEDHGADTVTIDHALAWSMAPATGSPAWWAVRMQAVRGFAAHLHTLDPRVQVPPAGMIRAGSRRATPYLYSGTDISAIIAAAGTLRYPLLVATYQTLISLLAVTGMRIGEAIRLDHADVDTSRGLLVVRDSKFGKSRQVPLHPTTTAALQAYLDRRDDLLPAPASPAVFVSSTGTRLHHSNIQRIFARLTRRAGLTPRSASCRPRIHDLRHSFAVRTVLDWYGTGADVQALMPRLSTYLGHTDPAHTFWYLSAAPELLALAGQRRDEHAGGLA